jgi:hypothetical protein
MLLLSGMALNCLSLWKAVIMERVASKNVER